MGNDGGSIPDRRDLVKNKPKAEQADKANQTRARWFFCSLSKRPLQEPVVSCALGKLYNKDVIIEFLIDRSAYGDGEEICGHVRSLKDVKTLKLTHNTERTKSNVQDDSDATVRAQFICPITLKEMNGSQTFVYLATCGCVISMSGLKALSGKGTVESPTDDSKGKEKASDDEEAPQLLQQFEVCPNCATKYSRSDDVRTLNPTPEIEEKMREALDARRLLQLAEKKSKKRKSPSDDKEKGKTESAEGEKVKKLKTMPSSLPGSAPGSGRSTPVPSINPRIAAASRAVASSLAMEEAKRKANMTDAVKSLYEGKQGKKETFMTRGTYTRYA